MQMCSIQVRDEKKNHNILVRKFEGKKPFGTCTSMYISKEKLHFFYAN
jgi:hypothetical protein